MENFVISQHTSIVLSFISVNTQKHTKSDNQVKDHKREIVCFQSLQFGICENSKGNLTSGLEIMIHYIAKLFLATTMVTTW